MPKQNKLTLVIGDQNLSSWSMRPWLALRASGLKFVEKKILLDRPDTRKKLLQFSPSGRVPALHHGRLVIWDSLAICEYIHELAPEAKLLPLDAAKRATARSYMAEMHSSFSSLRAQLSMDIGLRMTIKHLTGGTAQDIERIVFLWKSALRAHGGPYLFGERFSAVDAFYAPVVMRFVSYGVVIRDPFIRRYMQQMQKNEHVRAWIAGAKKRKSIHSEILKARVPKSSTEIGFG